MKTNIWILSTTALICFISAGCGYKTAARVATTPPPETILDSGNDNLKESLFKGDQAVLSDQDIARILGTQVKLTDRHRLAILNLSPISLWSEDHADLET